MFKVLKLFIFYQLFEKLCLPKGEVIIHHQTTNSTRYSKLFMAHTVSTMLLYLIMKKIKHPTTFFSKEWKYFPSLCLLKKKRPIIKHFVIN